MGEGRKGASNMDTSGGIVRVIMYNDKIEVNNTMIDGLIGGIKDEW